VPTLSPEPSAHLDSDTALGVLGPVLADPGVAKCGHNLKFDARVLLQHKVAMRGVVCDTMLAATLMDPAAPSQKLDALALQHLGWRMVPISDLIGASAGPMSMAEVAIPKVVRYAAEDADIALRLCRVLQPRLEEMGMARLLREVESPLTTVLAEMEWNGIRCDPEELRRQGEALQARVDELRRRVWEAAGVEFQIDSPKQLGDVLFDRLGLTSVKKTRTGRSTDIEVLEKLAAQEDPSDPRTSVPRLVIEYRQLQKLIGTYLTALAQSIDPTTGRIHTTFHQLVTSTGRLASQGPNLQNIPVRTDVGRQVRKAFVAPPGCLLVCADYSQIELRILAHLSQDPALIDAFREGQDIHTAVASQVFGVSPELVSREMRNHAKTINFGIIYGVTAFGLARRIEGMDVETAGKLIADYRRRFAGIDRFLQQCVDHATTHGYVATFMGRRRAIPEVKSANAAQRALGERLAINTVVQGSAADLMKLAMVRVQNRIDRDRLPMRMLLQIHDELVLETPEERAEEHARIVKEEMEGAMALSVPLLAETGVGPDWLSAK
jgi:DNA polymerase-1